MHYISPQSKPRLINQNQNAKTKQKKKEGNNDFPPLMAAAANPITSVQITKSRTFRRRKCYVLPHRFPSASKSLTNVQPRVQPPFKRSFLISTNWRGEWGSSFRFRFNSICTVWARECIWKTALRQTPNAIHAAMVCQTKSKLRGGWTGVRSHVCFWAFWLFRAICYLWLYQSLESIPMSLFGSAVAAAWLPTGCPGPLLRIRNAAWIEYAQLVASHSITFGSIEI